MQVPVTKLDFDNVSSLVTRSLRTRFFQSQNGFLCIGQLITRRILMRTILKPPPKRESTKKRPARLSAAEASIGNQPDERETFSFREKNRLLKSFLLYFDLRCKYLLVVLARNSKFVSYKF